MSTPATTPSSRRGQIMQTYQMAKRTDPRIGLILLGVFLLGAASASRDVAPARRRLLVAGSWRSSARSWSACSAR